ncbi:MAG: nucleoside monophosphate kinase [Lactobacillaceae bacterium]|jgi:adenylate kinase|nr:nucleoside monophosphate kinase [Lactobacillaceae bacterium]
MNLKNDGTIALIVGKGNSGKGTQNQKLRDRYDYGYFSSGDILREVAKGDTGIGRIVKGYMEKGMNVPDEHVNPAALQFLQGGARHKLLDGYSRNIEQAKFLLENFGKDRIVIVNLLCSDQLCIDRASNRRQCKFCKETQVENTSGTCVFCRTEEALVIRPDDAIIRDRLITYRRETVPMIEYFREQGVTIFDIDVEAGTEATAPIIAEFLKPYFG